MVLCPGSWFLPQMSSVHPGVRAPSRRFLLAFLGREQGLQQMGRKEANYRHDDAVPGQMIGLVIVPGQNVAFRQSHQARRFARREQAGADMVALDDENRLPTGAAYGRAQAT